MGRSRLCGVGIFQLVIPGVLGRSLSGLSFCLAVDGCCLIFLFGYWFFGPVHYFLPSR
jgi:hypothetical protein